MSVFSLVEFSNLLRIPNLVVVALTQLLVYYRVILPAFQRSEIDTALSHWNFVELCLVTITITASGYLVNDLRDTKIDAVNRPDTNAVEKLGKNSVQYLYAVLIFGGYLLSLLLAFRLDELKLLVIYPLAVGVLVLYSTSLKRIPFLGNVLVALYCAGVPGILVLAERQGLYELMTVNRPLALDTIRVCFLFMAFAFVATLLRELVKDLEDLRGDRQEGRRTVPVLLGVETSRKLGLLLGLMVIFAILSPIFLGWPAFLHPPMIACIGILIIGILLILLELKRAQGPVDYGRLSSKLKLLLLGGLGLLVVF